MQSPGDLVIGHIWRPLGSDGRHTCTATIPVTSDGHADVDAFNKHSDLLCFGCTEESRELALS